MSLLQQFVNFLEDQKDKPSFLTIKNYKADIGQFINWFEKGFDSPFDPSKITPQILEQYKRTRTLSPSSTRRHISSLRKFFGFLQTKGIISQDPLEKRTLSAVALAEADPWMLRNFKSHLYEYKKSNLTIKNYINDMKGFFVWLAEVSLTKYAWDVTERNLLDKINFFVVEEYKKRLIATKFSPRTVNRKLSSLRNYINWAKQVGLILEYSESSVSQNVKNSETSDSQKHRNAESSEFSEKNYSSFPPLRLIQKAINGTDFLFDTLFILPIAKSIENAQYLFWKVSGKRIFKKNVIPNSFREVLNIQKEFYAPLNISTRYLPTHKRVWHVLRHVRPNWYKKYHSYSFTHYFHFAILIILASAIGFGTYNRLFVDVQKENAILGAATSTPPRILSFQGKLTDSTNNPITTTTDILFSIYNDQSASGAAFLWRETNSVKPDSDGMFLVFLGKNTPIPDALFSQNPRLFLGITVGNGPELSPRQELATVPFAGNTQTLQGLEPITNTTKVSNVVLALDSSGNLSIAGSKAHTFQTINGQFVLSGSILSLTTVPGSNSRVEIVPDGIGKIDLSKPIQNSTNNNNLSGAAGAVEFDDNVAILATTSAQSAFSINQNSTGPLISASTSGTAKFVVENDGTGIFSGDLGINGSSLTSTATTFNLLNTTVTTLNFAGATTNLVLGASSGTITIRNENAKIEGNVTLGNAATDTITFTGRIAEGSDLIPIGTSGTNDLGSSSLPWDNAYIDNIYSASTGTSGYWQRNSQVLSPTNISDDILTGATATSSALIKLSGTSGNNSWINTGNVGIGTTSPAAPFEVRGSGTGTTIAKFTDNNTTGCTFAAGGTISCSSDIRLKKNFENISYGLNAVMALKPVAFNWKSENDGAAKNLGFIAQEVEQVIPKLVTTDSNGYEQLNMLGLVPVLTKAFQEQQVQIASFSAIIKDINLTSAGDLSIETQQLPTPPFVLKTPIGDTINRIGAFAQLVAANIKVGLINASEVITSSLIVTTDTIIVNGQNLKDYISQTVNESRIMNQESRIISPVASIDQLSANIISPLGESLIVRLATPSAEIQNPEFIIQNSSGSAIAKIDDQGNASFNGQLSANSLRTTAVDSSRLTVDGNATVSGTLRANNIVAESIEGLDARISKLHNANFMDIASYSAQLSYVHNLAAERAQFNQGLMVFGATSLSDISVTGQLSIGGTMFVTENSIETLGTDLSLQSLRQGGLSIMEGLVYVDTDGNLKVQGDVSISGKLAVNIISPLPTSDLIINNASGSGILSVNQTGDIVASGSGTFSKLNFSFVEPALAVSPTELIASSSAGTAKISPYYTEVTIKNSLVTEKSVIYITPVGTPSAQAPFLMRQVPNDPALSLPNGSFTVGVESPNKNPIPFNWLIIN